jgi:DNA repair ATPase RecN
MSERGDLTLQAQGSAAAEEATELIFFAERSQRLAAELASAVTMDRMYAFHIAQNQKTINEKRAALETHGTKNPVYEDMEAIRERLALSQQIGRRLSRFAAEHSEILSQGGASWAKIQETLDMIEAINQEAREIEADIEALKAECRFYKRRIAERKAKQVPL